MADFFEDLGKKISNVAEDLGKKAGDTIEVEKLKSKIRSLKRANDLRLILQCSECKPFIVDFSEHDFINYRLSLLIFPEDVLHILLNAHVQAKAGDTIEVEKLKSKIRSLKRANERDFLEIGKMVYDKFKSGEISDLDYTGLCESIEERDDKAAQHQDEIQKIKEAL